MKKATEEKKQISFKSIVLIVCLPIIAIAIIYNFFKRSTAEKKFDDLISTINWNNVELTKEEIIIRTNKLFNALKNYNGSSQNPELYNALLKDGYKYVPSNLAHTTRFNEDTYKAIYKQYGLPSGFFRNNNQWYSSTVLWGSYDLTQMIQMTIGGAWYSSGNPQEYDYMKWIFNGSIGLP